MNSKLRSVGWSSVLLGGAALALAIVRRRRETNAARLLKGKVVLITGGSRGLGYAIAQQLAALGARLVLVSRHADELRSAKDRLLKTAGVTSQDVMVLPCDVSVPQEIQEVVTAATAYFGRIDVVVNNAGIILVGPVESQTLTSFQEAMNINFFGALHTTLAVLPEMLARGDGAIVNIASIGGKVAFPHLLPYVASKFALVGWSQGLHAELAEKGIDVITVTPGIMRTGSHVQARYTGNTEEEYRWFATAASFPGTATNAKSAARKVVQAILSRPAEISIGLQAIAAARLSNLAPELTATLLSTANRFLPDPPAKDSEDSDVGGGFWGEDHSVKGKAHRGSLPAILEWTGKAAIEDYNQELPGRDYVAVDERPRN
jgi:short-subunit dehydrogenase